MELINSRLLFRLSVLGPLMIRDRLEYGELKSIIHNLAQQEFVFPNSKKHYIGEKTIEDWYYAWRRNGLVGRVEDRLVPALPHQTVHAIFPHTAFRCPSHQGMRRLPASYCWHFVKPILLIQHSARKSNHTRFPIPNLVPFA